MEFRDRIKELRRVPASELIPNDKNFRDHSPEQMNAIRTLLSQVGFAGAELAFETEDGLKLIDGHARSKIAEDQIVPVLVTDLTEAEADIVLASFDHLGSMADADEHSLRELLESIETEDDDLAQLLADLAADHGIGDAGASGSEPLTDPDDVPEPPEVAITELGDIWILGDHQLICGDSADPESLGAIMGDDRAEIVWTDPPWNVAYGATKHPSWKSRSIKNDNLGDKFSEFTDAFVKAVRCRVVPGAMIYVAMSAQEWPTIHRSLSDGGFHWSSTIIWAKDRLVLSRKDYHTQYEPLWYGHADDAGPNFEPIWYGWEDSASRVNPLESRKQSDLWEFPRPAKSADHPTMKPIELVVRSLENSSKPGDMVIDPFLGSGTTLIAAEMSGRVCRGVELDELYCDVIVRRWENLTGRKAERIRPASNSD